MRCGPSSRRIATDAVSVKGKTNEGVDAVGRGEAIAAHVVAVLVVGVGIWQFVAGNLEQNRRLRAAVGQ